MTALLQDFIIIQLLLDRWYPEGPSDNETADQKKEKKMNE